MHIKIKGSFLTRFCLTYSLTDVIYDGTGTQSEIFLGHMGDNGRLRVASPPQSSVALWGGYVALGDDNQGGH